MIPAFVLRTSQNSSRFSSVLLSVVALFAISFTTACGSSGNAAKRPPLSGNTQVTVFLSSTANDEFVEFNIGLTGISLTSQSGKTVTLLTTPKGTQQWVEFIHVNGEIEPLATLSVPQDVYTAANVTIGQSAFTCVTLTPAGGLDTSSFAYGTNPNNAPPTTVTVNLASPITITGDSMGLSLDLQVVKSASYTGCYVTGIEPYSITPTFNLTPVPFSSQPTGPQNGKAAQLDGQITAIGGNGTSFTLALPDGPRTVTISTSNSTTYQGISGFSALALGTFVDMDGATQTDGSLLASRIAVLDAAAVDVQSGPVLLIGGDPLNGETSAWVINRLSQGQDQIPVEWPYNISAAAFQVSGQFSNLPSLPFVPAFNASNVVAGQNVYVSTLKFQVPTDPYTPASTATLMPQTINGTVLGSAQNGNFTDYAVSLASYDLFPALAVQQGQTTLLTNPGQVEVYVDSSTQLLNTQALAPGSTLRFYGLVFNDNGTLRMDCAQVNDGVTGTSLAGSGTNMSTGQARILRKSSGPMQQTTTIITR